MKILLLVDSYLPARNSAATAISDLALGFVVKGHEVTVLTPSSIIKKKYDIERNNNLSVVRVKSPEVKPRSKIQRAIVEMLLCDVIWFRARRYFKNSPHDCIIFYSPTIFWGKLVRRLRELWHSKTYLVLRDLFPQWALDEGLLKKGVVYYYFKLKERQLYSVADKIGVQSRANVDYFDKNFPELKYKIEVLYNWFNPLSFSKFYINYRKDLNLENKFIFVYGGNLGLAQDMDNILRLAKRFSDDERIHFLLVGDGDEKPRINQLIKNKQISNMTIVESKPQSEYLALLSQCNVGLVSLDRRLKIQNFPGKMLSYFSAEIPVLASINPGNDLKEMLEEHHAGLVCHNGDDDLFYQHALSLINDEMLRIDLIYQAKYLLRSIFSVNNATDQLLRCFK